MPSFSSVDWTDDGLGNPVKMHANKQLITGWLKNQQHFQGFVISDWRAIRQLPGDYRAQVKASVLAGVDMFMEPIQAPNNPTGWDEFIPTLTDLVGDGEVPMCRIDDAVSRILTSQVRARPLRAPADRPSNLDQSAARRTAPSPGGPSPRARCCCATSSARSRSGQSRVYVAGSNADNIGNQAGGWTLTWQGGSTNVIPGQTILDGIERAAEGRRLFSEKATTRCRATRSAWWSSARRRTPRASATSVAAVGLRPRRRRRAAPKQTMEISAADKQAIRTVCARPTSCTVLVVSGRPLIIPPALLTQIDALVASWLPGSEGGGVADVLYGRSPFIGKLPVTWPRTVAQEPINVGDAGYNPLYRYGFGLSATLTSGLPRTHP